MMLSHILAAGLVVFPSLASAAIFPSGTQVKMIDTKGFRKAMKQNTTSVVAFVAPWCGHCQRMAPEYSKAAEALSPMVPLYAVDCDQESNKRLCSEQGVQGFPTVKLYPRGGQSKPIGYESGQRTANNFFYWASRNIPHGVKRLDKVADVAGWVDENDAKPRALLLNSGKEMPLMWKALGNKYKDQIAFAVLQDKSGKSAVKMGAEEKASKASKVLIYPTGSSDFVQFEGRQKFNNLDKYLKSVADGTAEFPKDKHEEEQQPDRISMEEKEQATLNAAEVSQTEKLATRESESTSSETPFDTPAPSSGHSDAEPSAKFEDDLSAPSEGIHSEAVVGAPDAVSSMAPAETAIRSDEVEKEDTHAKDEL